jgi:HK97 family phage major capsid protein
VKFSLPGPSSGTIRGTCPHLFGGRTRRPSPRMRGFGETDRQSCRSFPFAIDGLSMPDKPHTIVNSRAELRTLLQGAGLARSAADAIARVGWTALAEETQSPKHEDLEMSIQDLREKRAAKALALQALVAKPGWKDEKDKPAYNALMGEIDAIDVEMKRLVDANERLAAGVPMMAGGYNPGNREHLEVFTNFLRAPKDMRARQALAEFDFKNAASGVTDPAGGFLIPEEIVGPLMRRAVATNPFRSLVRVVQVATRDVNFPLSNSNSTTGWVGEAATRTPTTEATIANAKPTFGTLYSYVTASEELVMDSAFDIAEWFTAEAGDAMGAVEMTAIVSGNGTDKPTGLLNAAPTTGADGTRAAGVFKYLPTGAASTLGSALADLLIDTVYDLKAGYRANATWLMNSAVAGEVRKLKDTAGRFLWADSLAPGEPATLLGFPVAIAESMPAVATNALPIMFGDFSRAYILAENGGLRVTVDDNITVPGQIKWYIRRRLGGIVYDQDAARVIKCAAS